MNKNELHPVVENLNKIMNDRNLSKVQFAEMIGFTESKWNKISNGKQNLSVQELSKIARLLGLKEVDIYTYPQKLILDEDDSFKAQLTLELNKDLKEKVLDLVFGNDKLKLIK